MPTVSKEPLLAQWIVGAVQMNSGANLQENLNNARELVTQAAAAGAEYILLPEYFYLMGLHDSDRLALAETPNNGEVQYFLSALAAELGIWLQGGTLPMKGPDAEHIYNSCLLYDPSGVCVSRYDKIHLFNLLDGAETYLEKDTLAAGSEVVSTITPFGILRSAICYDLRFPELFREGQIDMISLPAAFTKATGAAHWEVLLRARAIENQCWVIAAAQVGMHPNGKETYGHSMIIDPWGKVLSETLSSQPGFVLAILNKEDQEKIRIKLPVLQDAVLMARE